MRKLIVLFAAAAVMHSCKKSFRLEEPEKITTPRVDHASASGGGGNDSVFTTQTYAGALGSPGLVNGALSTARFNGPEGVAFDSNGNLYVTDRDNNCIRKITTGGTVSVFAGSASGVSGFTDGTGTAARFYKPIKLAVGPGDTVYVCDRENNAIRNISPAGVVTTLAGTGTAGFADGPAASAQFSWPLDIAVNSAGVVYIADSRNNRIRKIVGDTVSTLAGSTTGYVDGSTGATSRFNRPSGLVLGTGGNLVVADRHNHCLRRVIVSTGQTTTYAGRGGSAGYVDGPALKAQFNEPFGVACTSNGTVYVADMGNHSIRMMRTSGGTNVVTTIGGNIAGAGATDGDFGMLNFPTAIAVDDDGDLFVADLSNDAIRRMTTTTRVLQKTYGFTATTVATGLTWYRMEDVQYYQLHFDSIQPMNINVLDLHPDYYKFYHHTVARADRGTTTALAQGVAGAVAAINGTYGNRGAEDTTHADFGHHASFAKRNGSIIIDSDGAPWDCDITPYSLYWFHHEGEFHYDFSTDTYGTSRCNLGISKPYTYSPYTSYSNMFSAGPTLIENYTPVGLDTSHYAIYPGSPDYKFKMALRLPRTAIAVTADKHILLITVDGGTNTQMKGLGAMDLTRFLNTYFRPQYALNLDGGGSTTMGILGHGDNGGVPGGLGVVNWPRGVPSATTAHARQRASMTNALVVVPR